MKLTRRKMLCASGGTSLALGLGSIGCHRFKVEPDATGPVATSVSGELGEITAWLAEPSSSSIARDVVARVNAGLKLETLYHAGFLASLRVFPQHSLGHASLAIDAIRELLNGDTRRAVAMFLGSRELMDNQLDWLRKHDPVQDPSDVDAIPDSSSEDELAAAITARDIETAERAAISLYRQLPESEFTQVMWRAGCRDFSTFGHRQIATTSHLRSARMMGWDHAEGPIRGLVRRLSQRSDEEALNPLVDYTMNVRRTAPAGWMNGVATVSATWDLLGPLRETDPQSAVDLVLEALPSVSPESIWDALVIHSVESMFSSNRADQRGVSMHRLTSMNAQRTAYRAARDERTKLLILLQAASMCRFLPTAGDGADTILIEHLTAADRPSVDGVSGVLEMLDIEPLERPDAKEEFSLDATFNAARQLVRLVRDNPHQADAFQLAALGSIPSKATNLHEYKYPFAVVDEAGRVDPSLRAQLLATMLYYLHASDAADIDNWSKIDDALGLLKTPDV